MSHGRAGESHRSNGRAKRTMSLNARYDNLVMLHQPRPLRLRNPPPSRDKVDCRNARDRAALYERFGISDVTPRTFSSIELPHLPSRLHALDQVRQRETRRTLQPRDAVPESGPEADPEPEQWLVDIMFPEHSQQSTFPVAAEQAPSSAPSPAVSPFEDTIPLSLGHQPYFWQQSPQQMQIAMGHSPAPALFYPQPVPSLESNTSFTPLTTMPNMPSMGVAGWAAPWGTATIDIPTPASFVPLWLAQHGVVDAAGRPIHLPLSVLSPQSLSLPEQRSRRSSRRSGRKRRRRRSPSASSESDLDRDRKSDGCEDQRPPLGSHPYKSPNVADSSSDGDGLEVAGSGKDPLASGEGITGILKEPIARAMERRDEKYRPNSINSEHDRDQESVLNPKPFARPGPSAREQDLGARVHGPSLVTQPFVQAGKSCDVHLSASPTSPQRKARIPRESNRTPFPTLPSAATPITSQRSSNTHRDPCDERLSGTLKWSSPVMPEAENAIMRDGSSSPFLQPVAVYPPTPATTVPSSVCRSHPSAQTSSEFGGKSPARVQRATERAWAALAAMQPRHEQQDPVAEAMPAPPSPALAPVDAEVSDEGEAFIDVEDEEEIYQFSDDEHFGAFDAVLDADVPQFDLSWDDEEEEKGSEAGPCDQEMPRSNLKSGVTPGHPAGKRVRFAWDIGSLGESDPGFKVWRDGY
ncbi:hypothetical protein CC85DRAFT_34977 [Cutaneotrichosporon oleaginosum]|uniref:Uncharacterized protein n=1 Tax=Cutaneotrichosporon oleaginosum TaxID=879819 RepID=A0A0J0XB76_9TREE|nr:uncharacterized protein CC85DRAFT_34977 [Cutaneotrichosporon oleaginosum]KLT38367.1 hypothetical protein CC85DRAFT_34977 [Cutaneotrichosporon oleaginosum]TXT07567.1 hypothetical protein COLE_04491 [Cutaneotrichosporon oleaginosum]